MIKVFRTTERRFKPYFQRFLQRGEMEGREVERTVRKILDGVRDRGDRALVAYTKRFDKITLSPSEFQVTPEEIAKALRSLSRDDLQALRTAAKNIRAFHRRQRVRSWTIRKGDITLGQRVLPLETVGIYVPGGKAVYPSSVLMNAIPAKVAGVSHLVMCTPVPGGVLHPSLLAAADIAGVDAIFRIGGAQAVAAMAYGTETIPKVDKIVGPGNIYVATAKKLVFGRVGIDLFAGPSEIVVLADETADPDYVAADLLSQAEHDEMAVAVLVTPSVFLAERVLAVLREQIKTAPKDRLGVIRKALNRQGVVLITSDLAEAAALTNRIAPEHLSLQVREPEEVLKGIVHAGAIFLGHRTPQTLGDYVAGPSHVLPTGGTARFSSPLSVEDFVKRSSIVAYGPKGLAAEGETAVRLARAEGLWAHARAVEIRMEKKEGGPK